MSDHLRFKINMTFLKHNSNFNVKCVVDELTLNKIYNFVACVKFCITLFQ